MNRLIEHLLSIPKSLYVCLRLLPFFQAIKLPILVRFNVKCYFLGGRAILNKESMGAIRIGFQSVGTHDIRYLRSVIEIDGVIEFIGTANFGSGIRLCIGNSGYLKIGDNFKNSSSGHIVCMNQMTLGNNFLMGWDSLIMDTDFHEIECVSNRITLPIVKDVTIGNNVWIGARSVILKGSCIPDDCIIGANTIIAKGFTEQQAIIAGNPAKIVKQGYKRKI